MLLNAQFLSEYATLIFLIMDLFFPPSINYRSYFQMATKMDGETNGCTFIWKIENINHCCLKKGERIVSPSFIANALEGTKWSLWLYPKGDEIENHIGVFLCREKLCIGPENYEVNFQIAFRDEDGSVLYETNATEYNFKKSCNWGFHASPTSESVSITERKAFLLEDTLTVQCTIWNKGDKPVKPNHLYSRTIFKMNRKSFVWRIGKLSTLKSGLKNKIKDSFIDIDLVLNEELDYGKKLVVNINSFDESIKCFSFKISFVDSEENKEYSETRDYFADDLKKGELSMPLYTKKMMEKRAEMNFEMITCQDMANDVLSLDCEYIRSSKTALFGFFDFGSVSSKLTSEFVENRKEHYVGKEKSQNTSDLVDDLKYMYSNAFLCDTELRTSTRTFPVHKIILCIRSPVFNRMFINDMMEKNSGHVDISDIENDTMRLMLLYMYTDSLEDLQFESASKLYAAADKYQIPSLKSKCSSYLSENLCLGNVCKVLVFADLHKDYDLKYFAEDYVLNHDKEVFGSQEWKYFMDSNPKLAANIMYRKVFRG